MPTIKWGAIFNRFLANMWFISSLLVLNYVFSMRLVLSERVAVHFDFNGTPNGFQNKADFTQDFLIYILVLNGVFLALYTLIKFIPPVLVNIPWKEYWFATEERKAEAYGKLKTVVVLIALFVNFVLWLTESVIVDANLGIPNGFSANSLLWIVLGFLIFLVAVIFVITRPPVNPKL